MNETNLLQALFSNTGSILLVILFFGGSIFIHELGHYLAARWRGLKIESFSIGFGPRVFGWRKNGIDYRISLLPLGGYVKLPQLTELAALEGESVTAADELPPISYADKMYVAVAGAVFNLIFGFCLALLLWQIGRPSSELEQTRTVGFVAETLEVDDTTVDGPASQAGLRIADEIIAVDGSEVKNFQDIRTRIVMGKGRTADGAPQSTLTVVRNGEELTIQTQPVLVAQNLRSGDRMRTVGITPAYSLNVAAIYENSPAEAAGLDLGDRVTHANGVQVFSLEQLKNILQQNPEAPVTLTVERGGQTVELTMQPQVVAVSKPLARIEFGPAESRNYFSVVPLFADDLGKQEERVATAVKANPGSPANALMVWSVSERTGALKELYPDDRIVSINGTAPKSVAEVVSLISAANANGAPIRIIAAAPRGVEKTITIDANAAASLKDPITDVLTGFSPIPDQITVYPNPIEQFVEKIHTTFLVLDRLISRDSDIGLKNLMSPVGIARTMHQLTEIDIRLVLWFTVLLNVNLAVLNLLPIPVLDGGHMLFATINRLRRKPIDPTVILKVQGTFFILIFSLMFYVIFWDSLRWKGDAEAEADAERQILYLVPPSFAVSEEPVMPVSEEAQDQET